MTEQERETERELLDKLVALLSKHETELDDLCEEYHKRLGDEVWVESKRYGLFLDAWSMAYQNERATRDRLGR